MLLLRNVNPCLRFRTLEIPTYTTLLFLNCGNKWLEMGPLGGKLMKME